MQHNSLIPFIPYLVSLKKFNELIKESWGRQKDGAILDPGMHNTKIQPGFL